MVAALFEGVEGALVMVTWVDALRFSFAVVLADAGDVPAGVAST